jgi:predicted histidine transporter YuiF (NhaC family)
MFLDIFALVVIALLLAVVIWLVVLLGNWPGEIARKRNHPQTQAITALGWIGLITMGIGWFVAIVWAYYKPGSPDAADSDLQQRVNDLEDQLQQLQAGGGES